MWVAVKKPKFTKGDVISIAIIIILLVLLIIGCIRVRQDIHEINNHPAQYDYMISKDMY